MRRVIPITEQFQRFVAEVKESFWGDVYGRTRLFWQKFLERQSAQERDRYLGLQDYGRQKERRDYRNGSCRRHLVTVFGTLVLRVARVRGKSFLPRGLERFRAERTK